MKKNIILYNIITFTITFFSQTYANEYIIPEITAGRISQPIFIDGYLNDDGWAEATVVKDTFREWFNYKGNPADVKTDVIVGYDNENLYFGFTCYETDISKIRANSKDNYYNGEDDWIAVRLNPYIVEEEHYAFEVNPAGYKYSQYYYFNNSIPEYEEYEKIWFAEAKILDSCWTVEIKIPFQSLHYPSRKINFWRIDFRRRRNRNFQCYYHWAPHPEASLSFFSYYGKLYINDVIMSPENIELLPYGFGGITIDTINIRFMKRVGISGKYYLNNDNLIDWSVIPDYTQIESDDPQIDINTPFALYYIEKRPFFTEKKQFFETPINIFYSRMINDPLFAIKFTGNGLGFNFGYISALDKHTSWILPFTEQSITVTTNETSFSNIFRIKRNFSRNSHINTIFISRDFLEKKNGFGRNFGVDGSIKLFSNTSISCQGVISWIKEPSDSFLFSGYPDLYFDNHTSKFDGEQVLGEGFLTNLLHQRKYISINCYLKGLSPSFRADNGFIQFNNFIEEGITTQFYFPIRKFYIQTINPSVSISGSNIYFKEQNSVNRSIALNTLLQNEMSFGLTYSLQDRVYREFTFTDIWNYSLSISASPNKRFTSGMFLNYGRQINYSSTPLSLNYNLYPSIWLELFFGIIRVKFNYSNYILWQDDILHNSLSSTIMEYVMNLTLFKHWDFRMLTQYVSVNDNFFISPLISYKPTPFTIFYLGSNQSFTNPLNSNNVRFDENEVFIKIQYLIKF